MPTEITAYKCAYCNRVSRTRSGIINHEWACKYNPGRRNCHTCKFCETDTIIIPPGEPGNEPDERERLFGITPKPRTYHGLICKYFNSPVGYKPYYRECETDWNERPMPGTCWYYEPKEGEVSNGL